MSEQCKYDEQVLDYLYGELADAERAEFAGHLASCAACTKEVEALSFVRQKAAALPKPSLSHDAAARMKAQLMEAALGAPKGSTVSTGGGKILAFPSGRVRRFMTHPATALFTVAAAAALLVVFTSSEPKVLVSDTPVPSPSVGPTVTVPVSKEALSAFADRPAPPAPPTQGPGVAALTAKKAESAAQPVVYGNATPDSKPADRAGVSRVAGDVVTVVPSAPPPKPIAKSPAFGQAVRSDDVPAEPSKKTLAQTGVSTGASNAGPREFAQPPPALAEEAEPAENRAQVRGPVVAGSSVATAPAQERRSGGLVEQQEQQQRERTIQQLERAELAQVPPPTQAPVQAASPVEAEVQAARAGTGQTRNLRPRDTETLADEDKATGNAGVPAADGNLAGEWLAQANESIRLRRCDQARETLTKIERRFPSAPGLVEAKLSWQQECGTRATPQNNLPAANRDQVAPQQNYQNLQQRNLALPSAPRPISVPKMERAFEPSSFKRAAVVKKAAPPPSPANNAPAKAKAQTSKADAAY